MTEPQNPVECVATPVPVDFLASVAGEPFVIRLVTPEQIAMARERVESQTIGVILGRVADGDGGFNCGPELNATWTWHYVPDSVTFPARAMEFCNRTPAWIEKNKQFVLQNVNLFCPWGGTFIRELNGVRAGNPNAPVEGALFRRSTDKENIGEFESRSSSALDPRQQIEDALNAEFFHEPRISVKGVRLYYIRQVTGHTSTGQGIVYYFVPEFVYLADIGLPRFALISIPYEIPTERSALGDHTPIGRGDSRFPDFKKAKVFSASGDHLRDLLYPAQPGELIIGVAEGVPELEVQTALKPYVLKLVNTGSYYRAEVQAFQESSIAQTIKSAVSFVRYAELNTNRRDISSPWFVDRVL